MATYLRKIIIRNDTASNWSAENPVLDEGEIGYETDTGNFKIGDAVTLWNDLYPRHPEIVGTNNTVFGADALVNNTTGSNNIALGVDAGRYVSDGTTSLETPENSIYIGYNSKSGAATIDGASNEIVIGYDAVGNGDNTVTLGNDSITDTYLKGNVGIGRTPAGNLHIEDSDGVTDVYIGDNTSASTAGEYGLRFSAHSNGNIYIDAKTVASSDYLNFRIGEGAETGAARTWMQVAGATGNVGIGTSDPGAPLQVGDATDGNKDGYIYVCRDTDPFIAFYDGDNTTIDGRLQATTNKIMFTSANGTVDHFTVETDTGNVGIGTSSPSGQLHIAGGSTGTDANIYLDNTGTGGDLWRIISTQDTHAVGGGKLQFYNGDTSTTALLLDSSGNVDIGGGYGGGGATIESDGDIKTDGQQWFAATTEDKISLYGNRLGATDMYGFGVEAGTLYYKADATHRWYINTNADGGTSATMQLDKEGGLRLYSLVINSTTSYNNVRITVFGTRTNNYHTEDEVYHHIVDQCNLFSGDELHAVGEYLSKRIVKIGKPGSYVRIFFNDGTFADITDGVGDYVTAIEGVAFKIYLGIE